MRRDGKFWFTALLLCVWPMAASADDDAAAKVVSECGAAGLPEASVDSCLERVRVLEETNPSSQLQTLEATLEQRESGRPASTQPAAAIAPGAVEVAPEPAQAAEEDGERDQTASQSGEQDSSPPQSGPALEDEPPVSDGPDAPSDTDPPTDEDTNDRPRS